MDDRKGPRLATVLPVFNEEEHIHGCLTSILNQSLDADQHMVMVLDGGSTDNTVGIVRQVMDEQVDGPQVVFMENPLRTVAHARNLALAALPDSVEFIVEMIGHAEVTPHHLQDRMEAWEACQKLTQKPLAGVGVRVIGQSGRGGTVASWIEGAISSPLGQSGGQFAPFERPSETSVPAFVMHDRAAVTQVGGWDEAFLTSQDSELSMRLLKEGYALFRHPTPRVLMHKRSGLLQWWRMGHRYGFWRTKVLLRHPRRARWQEFLPWFGFLATVGMAMVSQAWWWVPPATYAGVIGLVGVSHGLTKRDVTGVVGVPFCLVLLHVSFSLGLVDGLIRKGRHPRDRN